MSLYKEILSKSIKIVWNNKYLWFFGIFATFLGSGYEILLRGFSRTSDQPIFPGLERMAETGILSPKIFSNIGQVMKEDFISFFIALIVLLIILILIIFLIWLAVISQAALVNNSAGHLAGKKYNLSDGIVKAKEKFWPVLGLNIFLKAIIYLSFIIISLIVALTVLKQGAVLASLFYILAYVIFVPLILALSFIIKYAIAFVVIKNNDFISSFKSGWELFRKNWLISLEMAFILFMINFIVGLALVLLILTLTIPFLFLVIAFYKMASLVGFWIIGALAIIVFLIIVVLGGAILSAFQISSWTGLFLQLVNKGGTSKIIRIAESIKSKIS